MAYGYRRTEVETTYELRIDSLRVVLDVRPGGRYVSSREAFDYVVILSPMQLRRRWEDVYDGHNDNETKMYRASFRSLPHHARAAMVAEWHHPQHPSDGNADWSTRY